MFYRYKELSKLSWIIISLILFNKLEKHKPFIEQICLNLNLEYQKWKLFILQIVNKLVTNFVIYSVNNEQNINLETFVGDIKFKTSLDYPDFEKELSKNILNNDFYIKLKDTRPIEKNLYFCLFNKRNLFPISEEKIISYSYNKIIFQRSLLNKEFKFDDDFEQGIYNDEINKIGEKIGSDEDIDYSKFNVISDEYLDQIIEPQIISKNKLIELKVNLDKLNIETINKEDEEIVSLFKKYFNSLNNESNNESIFIINEISKNINKNSYSNIFNKTDLNTGEWCSQEQINLFNNQYSDLNKYFKKINNSFFIDNHNIVIIYKKTYQLDFPELTTSKIDFLYPKYKVECSCFDFIKQQYLLANKDFLIVKELFDYLDDNNKQVLISELIDLEDEKSIQFKIDFVGKNNFIFTKSNNKNKLKFFNKLLNLTKCDNHIWFSFLKENEKLIIKEINNNHLNKMFDYFKNNESLLQELFSNCEKIITNLIKYNLENDYQNSLTNTIIIFAYKNDLINKTKIFNNYPEIFDKLLDNKNKFNFYISLFDNKKEWDVLDIKKIDKIKSFFDVYLQQNTIDDKITKKLEQIYKDINDKEQFYYESFNNN